MTSSSLSSKLFANVLKGIEQEKSDRIKKEWEAQRAALDADESRKRADAALFARQRNDRDDREQRERDAVTELERKARAVASQRREENRRIDAAAGRASVFRGSDAGDVKERLRREGVPEGLAQDIVRLRTLDQELENSGGMRASMREREDPTRQANNPMYRSLDASVDAAGARRAGPEQQYLRMEEPANVYQGASSGLAQPPGAQTSASDKHDGVRKGLGLSENPMYR